MAKRRSLSNNGHNLDIAVIKKCREKPDPRIKTFGMLRGKDTNVHENERVGPHNDKVTYDKRNSKSRQGY